MPKRNVHDTVKVLEDLCEEEGRISAIHKTIYILKLHFKDKERRDIWYTHPISFFGPSSSHQYSTDKNKAQFFTEDYSVYCSTLRKSVNDIINRDPEIEFIEIIELDYISVCVDEFPQRLVTRYQIELENTDGS